MLQNLYLNLTFTQQYLSSPSQSAGQFADAKWIRGLKRKNNNRNFGESLHTVSDSVPDSCDKRCPSIMKREDALTASEDPCQMNG